MTSLNDIFYPIKSQEEIAREIARERRFKRRDEAGILFGKCLVVALAFLSAFLISAAINL